MSMLLCKANSWLTIAALLASSTGLGAFIPDAVYFDRNGYIVSQEAEGEKPFIIDSEFRVYQSNDTHFYLDFDGQGKYIATAASGPVLSSLCVDDFAPTIVVAKPQSGTCLAVGEQEVLGEVYDAQSGLANFQFQHTDATPPTKEFNAKAQLVHGLNTLLSEATDKAGLRATRSTNVYASGAWEDAPKADSKGVSQNIEIMVSEALLKDFLQTEFLDYLNRYLESKVKNIRGQELNFFTRIFYEHCALFNFRLDATIQNIDFAKVKLESIALEDNGLRVQGAFDSSEAFSVRIGTRLRLNFYFFDRHATVSEYYVDLDINKLGFSFKLALSKEPDAPLNAQVEELAFLDDAVITVQPPLSGDSILAKPIFQFVAKNVFDDKATMIQKFADVANTALSEIKWNEEKIPLPIKNRFMDLFAHAKAMHLKKEGAVVGLGVYGLPQKSLKAEMPVIKWNGCDRSLLSTTIATDSDRVLMRVGFNAANQIMHSFWMTGAMDVAASAALLNIGFDMRDLGVGNLEFKMDLGMPPILNDCGNSASPTIQIGDVKLSVDFELFGRPISFDARVSVVADALLALERGAIVLTVRHVDTSSFDIDRMRVGEDKDIRLIERIWDESIRPLLAKGVLRFPFSNDRFALTGLQMSGDCILEKIAFTPGAIDFTVAPHNLTMSGLTF